MTEPGILPMESTDPIAPPGPTTFAIGVPSYNNAATIGPVLAAIHAGLQRAFPDTETVIIHADGGSKDGTPDRARDVLSNAHALVQIAYTSDPSSDLASADSPPNRPAALRSIFEYARKLQVQGLAILDANVTSITADWVGRLTTPIMTGAADYVAPYYVRHRFDGAMTNGVAYPLTRALFGKRLRYPLVSEFACSARLLDHYLSRGPWPAELTRFGSDVWLVTQALGHGFRLSQAFLGVRTQTGSENSADLPNRQSRVLGALFTELERHAPAWQKVRGSEPVPLPGNLPTVADPEPVTVDPKRALDAFRLGQNNLAEIWALVLPPGQLLGLRRLARQSDTAFRFPDELWARTVYDFALAYRLRAMNRDHLLSAFTPLFQGWFGAFATELQNADPSRVEQRIEQLCMRYEAEKPYLISRWRWPDRFNS